jgi:hypothetical protein
MGIDSHLSTCVDTQSPKYLEMAQGHISLSGRPGQSSWRGGGSTGGGRGGVACTVVGRMELKAGLGASTVWNLCWRRRKNRKE